MIVSIAAAYGGMALRDKTEPTISPAKTLDEGVIEFPMAAVHICLCTVPAQPDDPALQPVVAA